MIHPELAGLHGGCICTNETSSFAVKLDHFKLLRVVGKGAFGKVYEGILPIMRSSLTGYTGPHC